MTKETRLNAFDMNCVGHIHHSGSASLRTGSQKSIRRMRRPLETGDACLAPKPCPGVLFEEVGFAVDSSPEEAAPDSRGFIEVAVHAIIQRNLGGWVVDLANIG
jgi:hypothetical protein